MATGGNEYHPFVVLLTVMKVESLHWNALCQHESETQNHGDFVENQLRPHCHVVAILTKCFDQIHLPRSRLKEYGHCCRLHPRRKSFVNELDKR